VEPQAWLALQHVHPLAESRSTLHGLMREALLHESHTLSLSWPKRIQGKDQEPASPLADVMSAFPALVTTLQPSPDAESPSPRSTHFKNGDPLGNTALEALFNRQRQRYTALEDEHISQFEGDIGASTISESTSISITRIENYVKCPARDWYKNILELRDDDELSEDPNARSTGSLLHKILETFIQQNRDDYRQVPTPAECLRKRLHSIAEDLIAAPNYQPSLSEDGRDQLRRKWLPGLIDEEPSGILAVWLEHELSNLPDRFPIDVEVDIVEYTIRGRRIRGRIDRIDGIGNSGALIIDYKSGKAPGKSIIEKGLALQGILYAEALRPMMPNIDAFAALYSQLNAASEFKEDGWSGDPDLLSPKVRASRVAASTDADRAALLLHAEKAVDALGAGLHHNTLAPTKDAGCDYCAFHRICRHTDATAEALRRDPRHCGPLEST